MTESCLIITQEDGIATITLNRPEKRNALNESLIQAFIAALNDLSENNQVRVLIIKGEGEHFCAGGDIKGMQAVATGPFEHNLADATMLADLMYQLHTFEKPTIALAHGSTFGGGLGLLSTCDMVIAAKTATFGFSEVKIGLTPSIVSPYVIAAIGARAAQYYFLTGEQFHALDAKQLGLIHRICEDNVLSEEGLALAKCLIENSPGALTIVKHLVRHVMHEKITPMLVNDTAQHLAHLRATPEAQEGLKSFLEKRKPKWETR